MSIARIMAGMGLALLVMATVLGLGAGPARGQGAVFANSDPLVTIHSTFTGQTITLFGNIEPGAGGVPERGPYDVIVLVRGPASDRVVRVMERQFGIMLNADQALYQRLPGYYAVLSSRPMADILPPEIVAAPDLSLEGLAGVTLAAGDGARFDPELVRLMERAGLFLQSERGVAFLSGTTFATRIPLPASVPNGLFVAQALIVADGEIVTEATTSFTVRTEGVERFIARAARNNPFLYGLAVVLVAIATGWLGGVLFRR